MPCPEWYSGMDMVRLWEKMHTLEAFQKRNALPETPGAYFFLGAKKQLLYIGKATSLRDRVKSYFSRDIIETRGPKITRMLEQARFVAYRQTDSVLEALILESALIKKHQPPYNTDAKDDKSYNHVVITREKFPRVLIVRGRDIFRKNQELGIKNQEYQKIFGPFPSGGALREAMKIVRKLFPFRDRCVPYEELSLKQKEKAKSCFSAQIGLCPGVCTGKVSAREYQRTINHIRLFFEGRKSLIIRKLEREMKAAAQRLEFEQAGAIKKTLFGLRHIQDMALMKNESGIPARPFGGRNRESWDGRIEAYDIAHLGGDSSVGVMVVTQGGEAEKESYKKFILRGEHKGNDLTALEEILERRLKHTEWPLPDIIVVDGAEPQAEVARQAVLNLAVKPPSEITIVGVVKNIRHQPERLIGPEALTRRFKKEILLANSEAHRFAITFHRKRRGREFLSTRE